jgi:hypothetical protein
MNGLDQRGIAGQRWQPGRFRGPEEVGKIVLWGMQIREVKPGQRIFQVSPAPRNRVPCRTIRWQEHQAPIRGEGELLGRLGAAGVQQQEIQAVRKRLCNQLDAELDVRRMQIGPFPAEPRARGGLARAIHIAPREDGRNRPHRWDAARGEAPAADRQEAEAAFGLAEHPHGAGSVGWNGLLAVGGTTRLEGGDGLRVFWCDWAGPLCAWP